MRPTSDKPSFYRVISMRLIVTVSAAVLITAAVITVAGVAERKARNTLTREMETRLVLEARNLALLSSRALLSDYPELTLHPLVKEMQSDRPELKLVFVVDNESNVQGHSDVERLGTWFTPDATLRPVPPTAALGEGEELQGNDDLLVVKRIVLHPNGEVIGSVYVGLGRRHAEASAMAARKGQMLALLPILAVAVALTMVLMSWLLRPISVLRAGLERIGRGELGARVELESHTELDLLANSINDMADALRSAQDERIENERLAHEMELAREIQTALLPTKSADLGEFVISGAQDAAAEVGGDYFDVFPLDDDRVGIVIADVSGKGLAGCMVTSMIAVLVRTMRPYFESPAQLLIRLEESLKESLRPGTFITMFYGILNTDTGKMVYASAAHNPLLFYRAANGSVGWRKTRGIPVGMARDGELAPSLEDEKAHLAAGDVILLFTDGFNEAVNDSLEEYGFDRVSETVKSLAPKGGVGVVEGLREAVAEWEGGRPAEDDKTVVVIERAGTVAGLADDGAKPARTVARERLRRLWEGRTESPHLTIPAVISELDGLHDWLRECDHLSNLTGEQFALVEHGVYEIAANIAEHGCGFDANQAIDVWWIVDGKPEEGYFLFRDDGIPPRPDDWPWREPQVRSELRKGRGYGLSIIRQTMADVEYYSGTQLGNITLARFAIPQPDPAAVES